ncbi:hypothetical protein [Amycolatopsis sp. NPDC051716]|uniref:hypothetical protein n=1 Tax=Amycolatopsis sp. NPDC051716 TaxID=3155804 RepID=UPI00342450FF
MHALSDFASFTYRRRTDTLEQVVVDQAELVRRLIDTDREMAYQESVMHLSDDPGVFNSYEKVTRTLRDIRRLLDQGNPATNLAAEDLHPDHPEWDKAHEKFVAARATFVNNALRHIRGLDETNSHRAFSSGPTTSAQPPTSTPERGIATGD